MKKKNYNFFSITFIILFVLFVSYYIAYQSGYYEVEISKNAIMTEEGIKEFESDIKEGKEIDIKKYLTNNNIDYSSPMSKMGSNLSNKIDKLMSGGIKDLFENIGKLIA